MTQLRGGTASPVNGPISHLAVLEASPNAILAVDAQARITYVNPQAEATFGYPRGELIGNLVELLIPDQVADRHVRHRDGFLAHPVPRPMGIGLDLAGRRKDGTEFPVEISLSLGRDRRWRPGLRDRRRHQRRIAARVGRKPAPPGAEARVDRAPRRRHRPRLQQHAVRDQRLCGDARPGPAPAATRPASTARQRFTASRRSSQATERATVLTSQLLAFGRRQPGPADGPRPECAASDASSRCCSRLIGEKVRLVAPARSGDRPHPAPIPASSTRSSSISW